jgi:prolyl-tRNA synthetase
LRGDDTLNQVKAGKHPWIKNPIRFATEETIATELNTQVGSLGPVGLGIPLIVDYHARAVNLFTCGANQDDYHLTQVVWGRDCPEPDCFDLREVRVGDPSPDGLGVLQSCRGIEVGHVFQLGSRYAESMHAQVLNEHGKTQTLLMGCYGLGVSRIVAAAIEQHHDDKGIIWPASMAPFQVCLIPINAARSAEVKQVTEALYQQLLANGMDVLLDDRPERPGVLFSDHDLIGIPHRLVISERLLADGMIEYKARHETDSQFMALDKIADF